MWRYREFRNQNASTLRDQLIAPKAIDAFHRDPFDPHAIAAVRPSAYQKAIAMAYIDNLLDAGDDLMQLAYSRANPEYLVKQPRNTSPPQSCSAHAPRSSATARQGHPHLQDLSGHQGRNHRRRQRIPHRGRINHPEQGNPRSRRQERTLPRRHRRRDLRRHRHPLRRCPRPPNAAPAAHAGTGACRPQPQPARTRPPAPPGLDVDRSRHAPPSAGRRPPLPLPPNEQRQPASPRRTSASPPAWSLPPTSVHPRPPGRCAPPPPPSAGVGTAIVHSFVRSVGPAFCIPRNERLLDCWDRVEDRLYKLRHCLDIDGNARQLPLFAARIDPDLMTKGRAAGITLEDALTSGGEVPPYRFQFLLERARAYTGTVQTLGAGLLAALEKHDTEELTRLRNTHQRNVLALTTELRTDEVKLATEGTEIAQRRLAAAEYRRNYYAQLLTTGLLPAEVTQSESQVLAVELRTIASIIDTVAAIAHLVPDFGSPFSMKFGGIEVGLSSTSWAMVLNRTADVAELVATVAGMAAGEERRQQGWEHQRTMGQHDVNAAQHELAAAQLRQSMADRSLHVHNTTLAQQDEVIALNKDKFTNLALYTWLTRSLQRLHREAYLNALTMANLAERAYHFERPGDTTIYLGGEWDGGRSGLLAGDRLRRHPATPRTPLHRNQRPRTRNQPELLLAQLDPTTLVALKETGSCEFDVSELHMNLFYPGTYSRRIRAVRLTMPCITGPYTNVSARLSLLTSHLRKTPRPRRHRPHRGAAHPHQSRSNEHRPRRRRRFDLSFKDERYMPFEGAGAVAAGASTYPKRCARSTITASQT